MEQTNGRSGAHWLCTMPRAEASAPLLEASVEASVEASAPPADAAGRPLGARQSLGGGQVGAWLTANNLEMYLAPLAAQGYRDMASIRSMTSVEIAAAAQRASMPDPHARAFERAVVELALIYPGDEPAAPAPAAAAVAYAGPPEPTALDAVVVQATEVASPGPAKPDLSYGASVNGNVGQHATAAAPQPQAMYVDGAPPGQSQPAGTPLCELRLDPWEGPWIECRPDRKNLLKNRDPSEALLEHGVSSQVWATIWPRLHEHWALYRCNKCPNFYTCLICFPGLCFQAYILGPLLYNLCGGCQQNSDRETLVEEVNRMLEGTRVRAEYVPDRPCKGNGGQTLVFRAK